MNLLERIKEKTGIDIAEQNRKEDVTFIRSIYCKIMRDTTRRSLEVIGKTINRGHCTVLHNINNIFPHAMKSKPHRALYYELLKEPDPETLLDKNIHLKTLKPLLEEILIDVNFWLKPHHKRQLEELLKKC